MQAFSCLHSLIVVLNLVPVYFTPRSICIPWFCQCQRLPLLIAFLVLPKSCCGSVGIRVKLISNALSFLWHITFVTPAVLSQFIYSFCILSHFSCFTTFVVCLRVRLSGSELNQPPIRCLCFVCVSLSPWIHLLVFLNVFYLFFVYTLMSVCNRYIRIYWIISCCCPVVCYYYI